MRRVGEFSRRINGNLRRLGLSYSTIVYPRETLDEVDKLMTFMDRMETSDSRAIIHEAVNGLPREALNALITDTSHMSMGALSPEAHLTLTFCNPLYS